MSTSAKDMLAQMASAAPKATRGKKDKPILTDPELRRDIAEFVENKRLFETAEALMLAAKDRICERVKPFLLEQCAAAAALLSSVHVTAGRDEEGDGEGPQLTYVHQCRYCEIPQERVNVVREALAKDADRFLDTGLQIALTPGAANDEAVLKTLMSKLGPDFVRQHFVIQQPATPTKAFHDAYYTDPKVRERAAPLIADQTIKQFQPALKLA